MTDIKIGPCPSCGHVAPRKTYDIGSGPELACASCEWCWGADGQKLNPLPKVSIEDQKAALRRLLNEGVAGRED